MGLGIDSVIEVQSSIAACWRLRSDVDPVGRVHGPRNTGRRKDPREALSAHRSASPCRTTRFEQLCAREHRGADRAEHNQMRRLPDAGTGVREFPASSPTASYPAAERSSPDSRSNRRGIPSALESRARARRRAACGPSRRERTDPAPRGCALHPRRAEHQNRYSEE